MFQSISEREVFIEDNPLAQRLQICTLWCTLHTGTFFWEPAVPCPPSWYSELCNEVMERLQIKGVNKERQSPGELYNIQ